MGIVQFLRIIWARRLLILAAMVSCVIGAYIVTLILPPRWEAHSRVMIDVIKPDPVTGQAMGQGARLYLATQAELITDYTVAGQVADQLGWMSDPSLIAAYERRPKSDTRDYRRWLAQLVIDNTKVTLPDGSNIIDIAYTATTPRDAKLVADALRRAYIDSTVAFRRSDAERNAQWFDTQSIKARAALDQAIAGQTAFERANGIVMANDKMDIDSARLQAMAGAGVGAQAAAGAVAGPTPAGMQVAQIDAAIAEESKSLGPNHPELQELKTRRKALAGIAAQEQRAQGAAIASMSGGQGAFERAVSAQRSKVVAQGEKIGKLAQFQSDTDLKREIYNHLAARATELRQEAAIGDTGMTPLGSAIVPRAPKFPNYLLIIPGSMLLGLGVGVLVALLMELFGRRVRCAQDLDGLIEAPIIGAIAGPARPRASRRRWLPTRLSPWSQGRRATA